MRLDRWWSVTFESAGDTPIVDLVSGLGRIPNLDTEEDMEAYEGRMETYASGLGRIPSFDSGEIPIPRLSDSVDAPPSGVRAPPCGN